MGLQGKRGAIGLSGHRGTRGATGPRGKVGKAGPKGAKGLSKSQPKAALAMVVTRFEDVYLELTAQMKRINEIQHQLAELMADSPKT